MDIALAALTGIEVELKVRIVRGGFADVIKDGGCQWRTSEIGVENDPRRVDERPQRVDERLLQLPCDRIRQATQREVQRRLIQLARSDFLPKTREHKADTLGNDGVSFAFNQCLDF